MSDTEFDVVIAAYLIPDLAQKEFDTLVRPTPGRERAGGEDGRRAPARLGRDSRDL